VIKREIFFFFDFFKKKIFIYLSTYLFINVYNYLLFNLFFMNNKYYNKKNHFIKIFSYSFIIIIIYNIINFEYIII